MPAASRATRGRVGLRESLELAHGVFESPILQEGAAAATFVPTIDAAQERR